MKHRTNLIRDRLGPGRDPNHEAYVQRKGPDSEYRVVEVPDEMAVPLLLLKLHEEVSEVQKDLTNPEEYADVLQALIDLAKRKGVMWSEVLQIRVEKSIAKGCFSEARLLIRP